MAERPDTGTYGKPTAGFRVLGTSLEPVDPPRAGTTNVSDFFVCSAGPAPVIDPDDWDMTIDGDAAENPTTVSIRDLEELSFHHVDAFLECAGNGRQMYSLVGGREPSTATADTQWMLGAIGEATWSGPRLRDVLDAAGFGPTARWVAVRGLDHDNTEGEPVQMCMPIDKACHDDTIIAVEMNGEPLGRAHGAPARLVVPGWVGAYWVKWLEHIEVSTRWCSSWRADEYYVVGDASGNVIGPATSHPVKSTLELAWDATIAGGPQVISGFARTGSGGSIDRVDWSLDGHDWRPTILHRPTSRWATWPFDFEWTAEPGRHAIHTRAVESDGSAQPDAMPSTPNTILWSAVTPHPVTVVNS